MLISAFDSLKGAGVDGMWGGHIDTIKSDHFLRHDEASHSSTGCRYRRTLIVPEIHTTFKALRWVCDRKQVFSDGSFMHTMFLTIFYTIALVEVYRSWEPAGRTVALLYDDVVWSSPVRTTPERYRRMALSLRHEAVCIELSGDNRQPHLLAQNVRHSCCHHRGFNPVRGDR